MRRISRLEQRTTKSYFFVQETTDGDLLGEVQHWTQPPDEVSSWPERLTVSFVSPDHSWLKNKYLMCLKLGCLSLLWPSCLVCKLGGTPLPVIGETEVRLIDADALPVLVTKDFPQELLIGSDAISRGNGKIEYGTRKVISFGQNFSITPYTDFIPHTASV